MPWLGVLNPLLEGGVGMVVRFCEMSQRDNEGKLHFLDDRRSNGGPECMQRLDEWERAGSRIEERLDQEWIVCEYQSLYQVPSTFSYCIIIFAIDYANLKKRKSNIWSHWSLSVSILHKVSSPCHVIDSNLTRLYSWSRGLIYPELFRYSASWIL